MIVQINSYDDLEAAVRAGNQDLIDFLYVYIKGRHADGRNFQCTGIYADNPSLGQIIAQDLKIISNGNINLIINNSKEMITIEDAPWLDHTNKRQEIFIELLSKNERFKQDLKHYEFRISETNRMAWPRHLIQKINIGKINLGRPRYIKLSVLEFIKKQWDMVKLSDRLLEWYKTDKRSKLETTLDWFSRYHPEIIADLNGIQATIDEFTIFDRMFSNTTLKENYLAKIKESHKNRKYYKKKKPKRTQFNINISPEIRNSIKKEAELKNISPGHLIELLYLNQNKGIINTPTHPPENDYIRLVLGNSIGKDANIKETETYLSQQAQTYTFIDQKLPNSQETNIVRDENKTSPVETKGVAQENRRNDDIGPEWG